MRILYRPVWEGMLVALREIFVDRFPADKVISRHLKANRKWGSHDRRVFAEGIYDLTRWYRRLAYASGREGYTAEAFARAIEVWALLNDITPDKNIELQGFTVPGSKARYLDPKLTRAQRESVPDWLDAAASEQIGPVWDEVLPILNTTAPIFLRANRLKITPEDLHRSLLEEKMDAKLVEADCLELKLRSAIFTSKAFQAGYFELQDLHSQKVAPALDLKPGMRLIDACAGGGGKSLHAAALMQNKGKVLALDVADKKLLKLRERANRAGATSIETRVIESSKTIKRLRESADRVLLDVPCSGLGVLRRNPDSKWKISPEELDKVTGIQAEILNSYSQMVKPGGMLVYATCSILPRENSEQIKNFLSRNETKWELDFEETLLPRENGGDGFYIARLRRS